MSISDIVTAVLSADNSARQGGEQQIKDQRSNAATAPAFLEALLSFVVEEGADPDATKQSRAQFAALMIKKQYLDERLEEEGMWQIDGAQATSLREKIGASLNFAAQSKGLLERKADIICKCHRKTESYQQMIQDLTALLAATGGEAAEQAKRKQFAMYNFEILAEYHLSQELIVENSEQFLSLFTSTLQDGNIHVKVAALKAISSFLSQIDDTSVVTKYCSMMPSLLDVVVAVLQQDEQQGQASLEAMIELTATHGDIWKDCLPKLIGVVSEVIKHKDFEEATRSSTLEIITSLAENMAALLRKNLGELQSQFFPAIAQMMTEIEHADDIQAWYAEEDTELQTKNDPASVAAETVQRISVYLGPKTTLACCSPLIQGGIGSTDWKEQCMGFNMLGMISEACKKEFKANLASVVQQSVSGFQNENPRVRFEALQSTGLLLNDLAPTFQSTYHADLIPALLNLMGKETELKMQTQATAAMTSMIRGLIDEETAEDSEVNVANKKLLEPYSADIVKALQGLFNAALTAKYSPLQEEVLSTLSCFASVLDSAFAPHYSAFMPGLLSILDTTKYDTQKDQELRASCIEVIGFILTSVKDQPEICHDDSIVIARKLIETLVNGNLADSDPQITAITNTVSQIAVCLKDEFKQFLPTIVPALLKDAQRSIDFKVKAQDDIGGDDGEQEKGVQTLALKVKGLEGAQEVSMNTNALEVKINAVQILKNLTRNLESSISDYVEPIAKVMIEQLLTDPYAQTIRKESAKCMRFCIAACKNTPAPQKALFIMTYAKMMEELETRRCREEFDQMNTILKELAKMTRVFDDFPKSEGTIFTVADATTFITRMGQIAQMIKDDKVTRTKKIAQMAAHVDDEDMEFFKEDLEKVDKGLHHIMEIGGFLLRNMGAAISGPVEVTLLPLYAQPLLDITKREDYELVDSVCMLCDCMEHGSDDLFNRVMPQAGQKFIEMMRLTGSKAEGPNYDIIQSCVFGLGLIAERAPNGQMPGTVLADLIAILGGLCNKTVSADLDSDEKESKLQAADNAISTLNKVVCFQQDGGKVVTDALTGSLLALIPLTSDFEEAKSCHLCIFKQLEARNPALLKDQAGVTAALARIQEFAASHTDKEEDILGEEGKAALQRVLAL